MNESRDDHASGVYAGLLMDAVFKDQLDAYELCFPAGNTESVSGITAPAKVCVCGMGGDVGDGWC